MAGFVIKPKGTSLTLNPNNDAHYLVERSETDGIEDLRKLALASETTPQDENEEAWLFLEGKDAKGQKKSFWLEIGYNETPTQTQFDFRNYQDINSFLKGKGLQVERGVFYHYHPPQYPGSVHGWNYLPSPADFYSIGDSMSKWNLLQNGVSPSEAMVTTRGVWRWEGKDLKIATSWPKAQELEKQLKDKLIYNELQIEHCANDLGICPEIFKDEARLLSSALIGVSYQPLASKFLGGSVQAIEASLLTEVMATEHQGFFENTAKHIEKINGTLSGEKLEIQYSDPETRVTVEVLSTGERQVKFRYVLDTNANPGDGRIYFTDYFSFTKGGKYQPKKFLRYFNHSSSLLTPQRFMNWAGELNKLGSPEISRQKSFAEKVVRKVLPKITEKFSK